MKHTLKTLALAATLALGTAAFAEPVKIGVAAEPYPPFTSPDASGKWVTPGIIDVHSHLGVYASPSIDANSDGNEATNAVTADR